MTGDTQALRKARGAFFTPPAVAEFIAQWAIRTPTDTVLEPSCGEAVFLTAAADRLKALGVTAPAPGQLNGVELHAASAQAAAQQLADRGIPITIQAGDFFTTSLTGTYTATVGNPPYVRYQEFTGAARAAAQEAALTQGVRLTGLSSSWAAFVVHAAQHLNEDGRLGLVLPAELLSVNYAAEIRRFLLRRFASVRLVLFDELVFPDALEDVVLLLAEGQGPTDRFEVYQARDAAALAGGQVEWASAAADATKWTSALLAGEPAGFEAYTELVAREGFTTLSAWGKSYLGAVTGNNRWFTLSAEEVRAAGLAQDELVPVSPAGSRHLRGLNFTQKAWADLRDAGRKAWVFYPQDRPSTAAQRRIDTGVATGVHNAYKCRMRNPWWRVPLVEPADLLLTYMNHDTPRLTANRARVHHLNSVHGVRLTDELRQLGTDLLPLAALNSVTLLGAEVVGRAYGGGMLKLEPREGDQLPVPTPATVLAAAPQLRALRAQLAQALRGGDLLGAAKKVDRVLLRGQLNVSRAHIAALREARKAMFERRANRGKSGRGTH